MCPAKLMVSSVFLKKRCIDATMNIGGTGCPLSTHRNVQRQKKAQAASTGIGLLTGVPASHPRKIISYPIPFFCGGFFSFSFEFLFWLFWSVQAPRRNPMVWVLVAFQKNLAARTVGENGQRSRGSGRAVLLRHLRRSDVGSNHVWDLKPFTT